MYFSRFVWPSEETRFLKRKYAETGGTASPGASLHLIDMTSDPDARNTKGVTLPSAAVVPSSASSSAPSLTVPLTVPAPVFVPVAELVPLLPSQAAFRAEVVLTLTCCACNNSRNVVEPW